MNKNSDKLSPEGFALMEFAEYGESRVLATRIAGREERHEDAVFADAMHVAAAIALNDADLPYTRPNIAWMFERIRPSQVLAVLRLRLAHPDEYAELPMAHSMNAVSTCAVEAATALTGTLTQKELDALFFSGVTGNA